MKDPAISVKDILVGLGYTFGQQSDWSIYIGQWPDSPNRAILINTVGGLSPEPNLLLNYPSIQILTRGKPSDYIAASDTIQTIVAKLLGMSSVTVNSDVYRGCVQLGDVAYLGQDENARPILVSNFRFYVEPAAVTGGHRVAIS